ncbi:hypothetical protein C9374_014431 [Naegleria lovaniensis]|uniref:Uncharacterized protein n=1 Tax=Naegleria lovaniensis TaxID=51637 RepID=A0AA88GZT7_NAELO|nr:uncharacterized protein C9374_014431 [Naegleria lovaniensis]KAG2389031.1 hypothetical protein C9374_014431 [Naegleria lovaniensis]
MENQNQAVSSSETNGYPTTTEENNDPSFLYSISREKDNEQRIIGRIACLPGGFNLNGKRSPPNTSHNVFVGDVLKIRLNEDSPFKNVLNNMICQLVVNDHVQSEKGFDDLGECNISIPRNNKGGAGGKSRVALIKFVNRKTSANNQGVIGLSKCFWVRTKTKKETAITSQVKKKQDSSTKKRDLDNESSYSSNSQNTTKKRKNSSSAESTTTYFDASSLSDYQIDRIFDDHETIASTNTTMTALSTSTTITNPFIDETNQAAPNIATLTAFHAQIPTDIERVSMENRELKQKVAELEMTLQRLYDDIRDGKFSAPAVSRTNLHIETRTDSTVTYQTGPTQSRTFVSQQATSPFSCRPLPYGYCQQQHSALSPFMSSGCTSPNDALSPTLSFFSMSPPREFDSYYDTYDFSNQ